MNQVMTQTLMRMENLPKRSRRCCKYSTCLFFFEKLCIFSLFFSCSIVHIVFSSVNRKHLQLQRMVAAVRMRMRMAAVRKVLMMSLQKLNQRRYFKFLDVGNMLLMLTSINQVLYQAPKASASSGSEDESSEDDSDEDSEEPANTPKKVFSHLLLHKLKQTHYLNGHMVHYICLNLHL